MKRRARNQHGVVGATLSTLAGLSIDAAAPRAHLALSRKEAVVCCQAVNCCQAVVCCQAIVPCQVTVPCQVVVSTAADDPGFAIAAVKLLKGFRAHAEAALADPQYRDA